MTILVNGKPEQTQAETLLALLEQKQIDPSTVVCELSGAIIPAEQAAQAVLTDGAELEILRFVGGG